jgi:membrane protease YdiL (CAAX protease family)
MKTESAAPDAVRRSQRSWPTLLWFGLLACGITWTVGIPDALARFGLCDRPVAQWAYNVTLFGPAIAAVIVSAAFGGIEGLKHLAATLRPWAPVRWYAFALLGPLGSLGFVMAFVALTGGAFPSGHTWLIAFRQTLMLTPLFLREELGWRGFLLPQLTRSQSPLVATAWTTLLWALWHIPAYVAHTTILYSLLLLAAIFPISVLFSFIFLRTRSIVPCLLFHSAIDCGSAVLLFGPLKQNYAPALAIWVCVLWLMAIPAITAFSARGDANVAGSLPKP